ncbi:cation-translocating P-type ATPase [Anaerocolumna xylanovorans]|uniref:Plasma-membrane calcium-translocating P-type ATPase/potassium and/or sodium efflux P-type ATPase,TIGR01523 n=1 Tax=Anaerocolumna xylanovorans DSM 12503 TaxID=1121345 RepID=A0A1M7XZD0_9FIRM|nr:cation-transporting P-type ATPase [Anaerocolumna xylanovorans]SHO44557.1 plasma-membrane calcium-translocating P-type ATPase/potassium and/or sodium efflux P-type ATPase,TIGR01523 [Anaerocolumna xylanovorans DSM 12503]
MSETVNSQESKPDISKLQAEEVYKRLGSSASGLTSEQAVEYQKKQGKNLIEEKRKKSVILIFLGNFTHLMAILLWIGGAVAFFAGMPQLAIAIWLVNVINGVFSFMQEHRAGKATEALKNMLPSYARVIRNGEEQKIFAEDLVIGDIILLEEGDKISADARLLVCSDLQVNQSTLTGESNPVRKVNEAIFRDDLTKAETPNLIFAGTNVSEGNGKAIVTEIGMKTEFGKIANLTQSMEADESPLQKELDRLTKQISVIAISFGIFFFVAAIFFVKEKVAASFIFALGMIVAFIPEGLLPTVTLALAMAVQRMSKRNALVKKLSSVETLGSTSVICTDKTGTLTQNEMTVSHLWLAEKEYQVTGVGYEPKGEVLEDKKKITADKNEDIKLLLSAAALCSNARLLPPGEENPRYTVLGDPTEACLGVVAKKAGLDAAKLSTQMPRLRELPFESRRKRMTTIHQLEKPLEGTARIAYTKGAPKEVMKLSQWIRINGEAKPMTEEMRSRIMEANDRYAREGLRVLAVAYRLLRKEDNLPKAMSAYTPDIIEQNLVFIGLIVMADPPRPEVAAAVEECRRAGIRIIMITGDYGLTAESIAKRIGIVNGPNPKVISGLELEQLSDETLKEYLKEEIIFARVAPEQKLRVVTNLQEMGEIVAVTGDGVNDSPALKKADIGVAMGIAGTDVAKEAADMILTDDNFASIVHAIEEGRAVYSNIRKFLLYILNSNMPEAVPSALFLFSRGAIPLPLTVMQILTIDLGTDMLPALGLGTEEPEPGIMDKPPRNLKEPLLNRKLITKAFLWYGLLGSLASIISYLFVNIQNGWPNVPLAGGNDPIYIKATTMTLAAIVFCQIGAVFNCRTEKQSVLKRGLFSNKRVNLGIVVEVILIALLVYMPPLQKVFHTAALNISDWLFLCIWPPVILLIEEIRKSFLRKKS